MKWRGGVVDFATRLGDDRRMKHADQTDVVIVGGGLNGPALALALAQAGLRVTVVDARQSQARAEVGFDGRAYALALASQRLLAAVGVWPVTAQPILQVVASDGRAGEGASPFALHFDAALLAQLDAMGVQRAHVTLHVGAGTFQPVKTENLAEHRMHSEWYDVPAATQQALADCRARGGRVVAVGTTTVRTLESWAQSGQACGETQIFITPGFAFQMVDLLVTNFHLPKSTLMMLVSAFAGYEPIMAIYRHAIAQGYRFFSYGDAMLLARQPENDTVRSGK